MVYRPPMNAALALADGTIFRGESFGAPTNAAGEVVFTTTMTGYQEVCTDPSFRGQIVCMTYPLIGNYGINDIDNQSRQPWIAGLVVREAAEHPSHYQSRGTIGDYLKLWGIPGISGVDTRALARHIRSVGDTRAILVSDARGMSDSDLIAMAKAAPLPGEQDVVSEVQTREIEVHNPVGSPHIVLVDCGVKKNIVESLVKRGAKVTVVPYGTPAGEIARLDPDGVVVSPGPGDPAKLDEGLDVVRMAIETQTPYFGICLGHQLLARAIGAETTKLKFGHRGGNQPVQDLRTGRVTITSQNHSYRVEPDTIPREQGWSVALRNLNDGSVEGLTHRELPVLSVQFHPEASPGPLDNGALFDQFLNMVRTHISTEERA